LIFNSWQFRSWFNCNRWKQFTFKKATPPKLQPIDTFSNTRSFNCWLC
jgi:hypothetical protein